MFPYLLILFTVLPALELALLIEVGGHIGSTNTILLIILTGIGGAALARYQGFMILQKIQTDINRGMMPSHEVINGLMVLVGGILLLTPGFFTDALGFALLIPWTRHLLKKWVQKRIENMIQKGQAVSLRSTKQNNRPYDDIDIN